MSVTVFGTNNRRPHPSLAGAYETIRLDFDDPSFVDWSNANAAVVFSLLGAQTPDEALSAEMPIAVARRAVIKARATLQTRASGFERPEQLVFGAPRAQTDGTVELRPIRACIGGLDAEGLRERIDALAAAIEALARRGATHIAWG